MRKETGSETPPDAPAYDAAVVCSELTKDYGSLAIKAKVGYLPGGLMHWPRVSAGYVIGMLAGQ